MEKPLLTEAITVKMAETMYSAEKVEEAKETLEETKEKMQEAKNKVAEEDEELIIAMKNSIQDFIIELEDKITFCEKNIDEFKASIANNIDNKIDGEKKLVWLEQKKSDLKRKLDDYKKTEHGNWESFKMEFGHDIGDLEKALNHLNRNKLTPTIISKNS